MDKKATSVTRIGPAQGANIFSLTELWRYRSLLGQMVRRQLSTRLFASPLNIVWGFIRPGIMTLALIYIRNAARADFGEDVPYGVYLFSGLCFWFLFAETTSQIAGSLAADAAVIQKVYYPRIISPLAMILSRLIDAVIIVLAIAVLQIAQGVTFDHELLLLLPAILTLLLLAFGVGVLFASLILFHPDSRKVLEVSLYLGLFLSPVFFSATIFSGLARVWYDLNPMVGLLAALRGSLFAASNIDYEAWGVAVAVTCIVLVVGLFMLGRAARLVGERL
jgi:lipopolysaccharide transport system permease protein